MAEYIDRHDAIIKIATGAVFIRKFISGSGGMTNIVADAHFEMADLLRCLPAADVEPVRHGRWRVDGDFRICLVCEAEINIKNSLGVVNHKNYCSCCGAKMDLEVKTDDD